MSYLADMKLIKPRAICIGRNRRTWIIEQP